MSQSQRPVPAGKADKSKPGGPQTHWYHPAIAMPPPPEPEPEDTGVGKARERIRRRQEDRRLPQVDWTWGVIGIALAAIIGVVAIITLTTTSTAAPPNGTLAVYDGQTNTLPTPLPGATDAVQAVGVEALPTVVIRPWDGQSRVTVLVMGIDKRPGEQGTGFRADSLILISLDPRTQRVGMLSIPRDLRVPIPGRDGLQPINAAYVFGELERPGFGPRLTADTVQYNLGIEIDHFVVLSFEAVINLIDAIGGITVDVPFDIDDEQFPDLYTFGYDPLHISAGRHEMDGLLALKYARTRHQDSDFDRTRRQQQVVMAIRDKVLRPEMLPELVAKAPLIWDEVSKGIITDIPFDQLLSLAWYAKDIPGENIGKGALDGGYILPTLEDGVTVLTINRTNIVELLTTVFGPDYNQ
ncbi:MAG: LCP family protein [Anaerolineae bacterium]|nr:LCP family protein [Anaerolineae bacterium]